MEKSKLDDRYNVLVIFHHCDKNNGGVKSMLDLMDSLNQYRQVRFFALFPERDGSAQKYLENQGVICKVVPYLRWDYDTKLDILHKLYSLRKLIFPYNYLLAYGLRSFIVFNHINLVYSNTITVNFGCILHNIYKIPHIWHFREFGWEDHEMRCIYGKKTFYHWANAYTDRIIVISESLRKKYVQHIPKDKLSVVYDDVSKGYIQKKFPEQFASNRLNFLIAGTLQEGKGQKIALEAIKELKSEEIEVSLYIAGDGTEKFKEELMQLVQKYNLEENVFMLGQVQDMNRLRQSMQVALVCSRYEAFGRVTVEAMLSGMLVIGADSAGTSELIQDKKTGYLYKSGSAKSLADVIKDAISNRKQMYEVAARGQQYAIHTFADGKCAAKVFDIIQECVKN